MSKGPFHMQIVAFRIRNFRSILDTGWVSLSLDNVTALVGQNESGKSAILDALAATFSNNGWSLDDRRHGEPDPEIHLRVIHSQAEVDAALADVEEEYIRNRIGEGLKTAGNRVTWAFLGESDSEEIVVSYEIDEPDIAGITKSAADHVAKERIAVAQELIPTPAPATSTPPPPTQAPVASTRAAEEADPYLKFRQCLFAASPTIIAFNEDSGLLPDRVDVTDDYKLSGPGAQASRNFLAIAGIDLKGLVTSNTKARAAILKRANRQVTDGFLAFWRQTIGKDASLELECSVHHHPYGTETAGKTYLEFLITDNSIPLYPKQRSRGTRWFISFFLQLRASAVRNSNRIFLFDEPGANLHEKAQADVLHLLEKIREHIGVIYSTHSPHLISYDALHRILAVERDANTDGHPTRVIGAHALGAASIDTLSPILTTMGVALSRQTAIQQHDNVLLEELSAYYYLRAFWILTKEEKVAHFLAATGASNLPQLAQLFLGWGLDFIVVLDDEPSGRAVYNSLKRDMFADDQDWAAARMFKIPNCEGIEDVFSQEDYIKHVLSGTETFDAGKSNSKWAKKNGAAKGIHALKFLKKVEGSHLSLEDFHQSTVARIETLVQEISKRLSKYQKHG